ncbi:MAG: MarR family transcriptional regulator [Chloroflexi bacterium]|nr:MarR family transcriptional regulator [Chloroflexota bacterium]
MLTTMAVDDNSVEEVLGLLPSLRRSLRPRTPEGYDQGALSPAQLQLLIELTNTGIQPMSELAGRLGVSFSTATELVDKLVRAGKVVRMKSERDRRQTLVRATPEAEALAVAVTADRRLRVQQALEGLSENEQHSAVRALRMLNQQFS